MKKRPLATAAMIPLELPLEFEEDPQHLGDGENHLPVQRGISQLREPIIEGE